MRYVLLATLCLIPSLASASDLIWQLPFCGEVQTVSPVVEVTATGYGSGTKALESTLTARIQKQAEIQLRAASISVSEETGTSLNVRVAIQKAFETEYHSYSVTVEQLSVVRHRDRDAYGLAIVGATSTSGMAGTLVLPNQIREQVEAMLNDFIACVLEARDRAGALKRPSTAPSVSGRIRGAPVEPTPASKLRDLKEVDP